MSVTGTEPISAADLKDALTSFMASDGLRSIIEDVSQQTIASDAYWTGSVRIRINASQSPYIFGTVESSNSKNISMSTSVSGGVVGNSNYLVMTFPCPAGNYRVTTSGNALTQQGTYTTNLKSGGNITVSTWTEGQLEGVIGYNGNTLVSVSITKIG